MSQSLVGRSLRWLCLTAGATGLGAAFLWGGVYGQEGVVVPGGLVGAEGLEVPAMGGARGLPARDLAPGVLTVVPPDQNAGETTIGPVDLDYVTNHPELAWLAPDFEGGSPHYASPSETLIEMGKGVTLRHPVWGLEFAFKPVRTIEVTLPDKLGAPQKKLVWYLVYRIRYLGGDLHPTLDPAQKDALVPLAPEPKKYSYVRFLSRFTLINTETGVELDSRILAPAISAIAQRERIGKPLLDTFQMAATEIKPSTEQGDWPVWGVATWTDVDPRTDFFMIQVKGLTNAYRMQVSPDGKKTFQRKALQIHFWRPGDTIAQTEDVIRLGIPAFKDPDSQAHIMRQFGLKPRPSQGLPIEERLDYKWIYR